MARRLTPEARRAEILRRTREMIAANGPTGLSLRAVARWCDMSAPGLLHHFDGLKPLLEELIAKRDAEEFAAAAAYVEALGEQGTLLDFADALMRHIASHPVETRNFDALEAEATALPRSSGPGLLPASGGASAPARGRAHPARVHGS